MLQCRGTTKFKTTESLKKADKGRVRERNERGRLSGPDPAMEKKKAAEEAAAETAAADPAVTVARSGCGAAGEGATKKDEGEKKEVVLVLEGSEKLKLKITVPASWASKPAAKLKQTLVKHLNAKRPETEVDVNAVVMFRESGAKLRGDALLSVVSHGETITMKLKSQGS